jgi:hypothetical protein
MRVLKEFPGIRPVGNMNLQLCKESEIFKICKLKEIKKVPSDELIHAQIEYFISLSNIFIRFLIAPGLNAFKLSLHSFLIGSKCKMAAVVKVYLVKIFQWDNVFPLFKADPEEVENIMINAAS